MGVSEALVIETTVWLRRGDCPVPLDVVVERQVAAGKKRFQMHGWTCRAWAADVYGGLNPTTRQHINLLEMVESNSSTKCRGAAAEAAATLSGVLEAPVYRPHFGHLRPTVPWAAA